MLIPVLQDRTSKPTLGTPLRSDGHWSVQGLVGAWAFNEGVGTQVFDAAKNKTGSVLSTNWRLNGIQVTVGDSQKATIPATSMFSLASFTVMAGLTITLGSANNILGTWDIGASKHFLVRESSGTQCFVRNAADTIEANVTAPTLVVGKRSVLSVTGDGQNIRSGVNGVFSSSASLAGPYFPAYANARWSLDDPRGGGTGSNVDYDSFFVYSRALSPAEIASLSANPWRIYEPEAVWVEVAGAGLTAVTSDLAAKWDVFSAISSDLAAKWDILNSVTGDIGFRFDTLNSVFSDISFLWDMAGQVTSDIASKWDVFSAISSSLSVKWDILNSVTSDIGFRFDTLNSVFSDLAVKWDVFTETNGDLTIVFDTRGLTASDLSVIWDSAGTVFSGLTLKWDMGDLGGKIKIIGSSFRRIIQ